MKRLLIATALVALLSGCVSTSGPMSLGQNRYQISSTNFWAWSGAGQQADALNAANEYCAKQGKETKVLSMQATDARAYGNVASGSVTFECVYPMKDEDPIALADDVYMLAGESAGYQGIKTRYELLKRAAKFCARQGAKPLPIDDTREIGQNWDSFAGNTSTTNSANSSVQSTSADLLFRCVK